MESIAFRVKTTLFHLEMFRPLVTLVLLAPNVKLPLADVLPAHQDSLLTGILVQPV